MRDRLPILAAITIGSAAILAIGVVVGAFSIGSGIRDRGSNDTISVTGSAKKRITADYVTWNASISSQQPTPQAATREVNAWTARVKAFLLSEGILDSELTLDPITAQTVTKTTSDYSSSGEIVGYQLTRSFEVRSARVTEIAAAVESTSKLFEQGIAIQVNPVQYVYTKLADIRPELLAAATKDALSRAKILVEATGGHLGKLRQVNVGVFQVTAPNSTDVSDYGVYDTTTPDKDVTAVVNVSFSLS